MQLLAGSVTVTIGAVAVQVPEGCVIVAGGSVFVLVTVAVAVVVTVFGGGGTLPG